MKLVSCRYRAEFAQCATATFWNDRNRGKWLAWNYAEDAWFEQACLARVEQALDTAVQRQPPGLILDAVPQLRYLRKASPTEAAFAPTEVVTHVGYDRLLSKFIPTMASHWAYGSSTQELSPDIFPGDSLEVEVTNRPVWVTFTATNKRLPRFTDDLIRNLGLAWRPDGKPMFQVVIPKTALFEIYIPTIFDAFDATQPDGHSVDWRARPSVEKLPSEPWGSARDMLSGKAALPELIAKISPRAKLLAKVLEPQTVDFSGRPFMAGNP